MNGELRVLRRSRHRARICGCDAPADAKALEAWLGERIDVVEIERSGSTFDVHYDDGAALPGRFLRALEDKLHALERSKIIPEKFDARVVHSLRGRVRLALTGISDADLATLTMLVGSLPGVKHTRHLAESRTMLVAYDPDVTTERRILQGVKKSDPAEWKREWHHPKPVRWLGAVNGTSVLAACILRAAPFPWLALGVTLNTARPLARSIAALRRGEISIDLLDVAATFAALATRRPTTAAFVIWMVGVGDLLLDISANSARSALSTVMRHGDQRAYRFDAETGKVEAVPTSELHDGERVVVHTGACIPADGRIASGVADVDEKALTGESRLLSKKPGDRVLASTVVVEGDVVVEIEHTGKDTEAAKVERILNSVGSKPLTLQRDALDFASKLVLPTFGVAYVAAAASGELTRAICVLITDFGTGIRIAVPTSALTAMSLAAREGIIVKGAQYLERLSKTNVVVFDKTGTLTNGVPEVVEVVTTRKVSAEAIVRASASAEEKYDHPVARALKSYASVRGIPLVSPEPGSERYAVGLGLAARIDGRDVRVGRPSWMESERLELPRSLARQLARLKRERRSSLCVALDGEVVGLVAYADGTRPESAAIVRRLRAEGRRRLVLLSGDSPEVVKNVARSVGIDEAVGGMLPEEKAEFVRRLRADGNVVAMVGDGINDAPALASADVGISMGGSTDVAIETADVVLLDGGLSRLETALEIGDRGMAGVRRNLGLIIVPNAIAIGLGALGFIDPGIAAVINNGATFLSVIAGTLPLLARRRHQVVPETGVEPCRSHPPQLFASS